MEKKNNLISQELFVFANKIFLLNTSAMNRR